VKEVRPEARRQQARLEFAFVYPDRMGRNVIRKVPLPPLPSTLGTGCPPLSKPLCALWRVL
jgi:hypothetical protein